MGLGEFKNGRYHPISKWEGSWAQKMQDMRECEERCDCAVSRGVCVLIEAAQRVRPQLGRGK